MDIRMLATLKINHMQTIRALQLLIAIITISSCEFNQSVRKDFTTGAFTRGDGIGCDDVVIEINGKTEKRNEFIYGEKVNLVFNNVSGLTKVNNKTYPGLSMHIVKNEKDTVAFHPDLINSLNEGIEYFPLQLKAHFRNTFPYQNNETYKVYITIWDEKGDGKFTYELPFTIKENDLLNIDKKGIEYSNIYLWNETIKQPVFDNYLNSEHLFFLILDDIEGLELSNEKVFPIFSIDLIDNNGNKILSNPNLLSDFENEGLNPQDLNNQLTAKITFTEGEINNPCRLIAKLKDKNSLKELNITTELKID